jgi:hypothetical protein
VQHKYLGTKESGIFTREVLENTCMQKQHGVQNSVPVGRYISGQALSFGLSDSAVTGKLVNQPRGGEAHTPVLPYLPHFKHPSQILALYSLVDIPSSTLFSSLLLYILATLITSGRVLENCHH